MEGIKDFPPDVHQYRRYLDTLSNKHRMPNWTMSRNMKEAPLGVKTAADRYQPGQYKVDRDFVRDTTVEVRKGALSGSASCRRTDIARQEQRVDKEGYLKGVRSVGSHTHWQNPTYPGQYESNDGRIGRTAQVCWQSAPSLSMPRSNGQEAFREKQNLQEAASGPGPETYEVSSNFDKIGRKRGKEFERLARRSRTCRWENQFNHIFSSIHASAKTQTRRERG
eukprot:TRINITY_DN43532_c0_g1_i1.p1 TRINITY_DN43532_c0_g1~~TRINITY_DN43532_c0_g1_i1.p1  ORF type:complete len:223 (-),score=36.80 TRINITY_DN43532_c0_g1_i1:149-817(-)